MPVPLPGLQELPHLWFVLLCTYLYGWNIRCMSHTGWTNCFQSQHYTGCGSASRLRHVPLVSRYFSEICRDPSLWPDLCVLHASFRTEDQWQSFLRWLAARASGLHTIVSGNKKAWVRINHLCCCLRYSVDRPWVPSCTASALPAECNVVAPALLTDTHYVSAMLSFSLWPVHAACRCKVAVSCHVMGSARSPRLEL